jgi:hypothetical protein
MKSACDLDHPSPTSQSTSAIDEGDRRNHANPTHKRAPVGGCLVQRGMVEY